MVNACLDLTCMLLRFRSHGAVLLILCLCSCWLTACLSVQNMLHVFCFGFNISSREKSMRASILGCWYVMFLAKSDSWASVILKFSYGVFGWMYILIRDRTGWIRKWWFYSRWWRTRRRWWQWWGNAEEKEAEEKVSEFYFEPPSNIAFLLANHCFLNFTGNPRRTTSLMKMTMSCLRIIMSRVSGVQRWV